MWRFYVKCTVSYKVVESLIYQNISLLQSLTSSTYFLKSLSLSEIFLLAWHDFMDSNLTHLTLVFMICIYSHFFHSVKFKLKQNWSFWVVSMLCLTIDFHLVAQFMIICGPRYKSCRCNSAWAKHWHIEWIIHNQWRRCIIWLYFLASISIPLCNLPNFGTIQCIEHNFLRIIESKLFAHFSHFIRWKLIFLVAFGLPIVSRGWSFSDASIIVNPTKIKFEFFLMSNRMYVCKRIFIFTYY